jgi:hypothetical protein
MQQERLGSKRRPLCPAIGVLFACGLGLGIGLLAVMFNRNNQPRGSVVAPFPRRSVAGSIPDFQPSPSQSRTRSIRDRFGVIRWLCCSQALFCGSWSIRGQSRVSLLHPDSRLKSPWLFNIHNGKGLELKAHAKLTLRFEDMAVGV